MADLVVGLGEREGANLRDQLGRAMGDPSLVVGYWIAEQHGTSMTPAAPLRCRGQAGKELSPRSPTVVNPSPF